jgi:hypothetical protein
MKALKVNPIYALAHKKVRQNNNLIIVVNGPTGSGKTYAALTMAHEIAKMLGTNFSVGSNVDFNFEGLLEKMGREENKKPGTPFIFEEVGAFGGGASSREWQSKANKFFNTFLQTSRRLSQIMIMTCPFFANLEASSRKLVDIQMETMYIDRFKRLCYIKPYIIQVNKRTGKMYFKYIRLTVENTRIKCKKIGIPHAPKDITKDYEAMKSIFMEKIREEIIDSKKKETEAKRYWKCENCEHSWKPRGNSPSYCPRCRKTSVYLETEPIST